MFSIPEREAGKLGRVFIRTGLQPAEKDKHKKIERTFFRFFTVSIAWYSFFYRYLPETFDAKRRKFIPSHAICLLTLIFLSFLPVRDHSLFISGGEVVDFEGIT